MIQPSNPEVLKEIVQEIETICAQLPDIKARLAEAEEQRREAECNEKRIAAQYESLRLRHAHLLSKLQGKDKNEQPDVLSQTICRHDFRYNLSERKFKELKSANVIYWGDLAQARVVKHHGRPHSLHPRLPDGSYRVAGIPVIGGKTIPYLASVLAERGLTFEMNLPDWIRPIDLNELPGVILTQEELLKLEAWQMLKKMPHGTPYVFERHIWNKNEPVIYIGDLVQMSEQEVLNMDYLGPKELGYIKQILLELGLSLGMKLEGWEKPSTE